MAGLGSRPRLELYQKIAQVRERMQLPDEALAWHKLVLEADPNNATSLAAVKRLRAPGASRVGSAVRTDSDGPHSGPYK